MKLKNFSNYEIYPEEGKVWSYKRNRFVGAKNKRDGYWQVALTDDDGEVHNFQLHRVIWMSVNGEIPENMEINHLTEDKNQNGIQFLELCTHKENCNFGTCIQRSADKRRGRPNLGVKEKLSKKVARCDLNGNVLEVYASVREAGRNGYIFTHIASCCRGKRKSHKGFIWRYV